MSSNTHDEIVRFVYDVTGEAAIAAQVGVLLKVADAGEITDEALIALANEFRETATAATQAGQAITQKVNVAELETQFDTAVAALARLNAEFDRSDPSSRKVSVAFTAAEKSVADLDTQLNAARVELTRTTNALGAAGVDTKNLAAESLRLRTAAASEAVALSQAAAASKETSIASVEATGGLGRLRDMLLTIGAFVGFEKLKDSLVDIVKTGEEFAELKEKFAAAFGGLAAGEQAFEDVKKIALTVPQSFEEVSAAAIRLRQLGFNPLDGSLQAVLDNASALGQTQDQLITTINALGAANVRGGVTLKNLVTLVDSGVPVFELLGNAMGLSADRVRDLASEGKLGSDSIKLLVTQLGQLRAGASDAKLDTAAAQIQKLKDQVKQFLDTIAESGALDFFRKEIQQLNDEVTDAAKSGKLQEIAQNISAGIVAGAKAIGGAAAFIFEHTRAITALTAAYAAFKIGGALISLGSFGKAADDAGAKTEKLGGSLKSLPANVRLAIFLVGVDVAIAAGEKLGNVISDLSGDTEKWKAVQAGLRDQIQASAVGFADIAAKLSGYRDQNVLAARDVANLSDAERDGYAERLAGLTKYLQAQVLYLTNLDRAGLAGKDELTRLAQLKAQLEAAKNGQLALAEGTKAAADALANNLSPNAALLANRLKEIATDSKAAGEFISKAFEGFDLKSKLNDVGDFALALDHVAAQGGKAADVLNTTLLESLKKLSGADLQRFQDGATQAISAVGLAGTQTSEVLQATLEVALDRLGVKAQDTGAKITKAGADTIATFNTVATNAQASAQQIAAAFDSALAGVKTVDEAKALGQAIQDAAAAGKISLKELTNAGRDLDERIRSITASVTPLKSQFDELGIKSQAQLNAVRDNAKEAFDAIVEGAHDGTAAQEDVVRAFKAYADAARASVADSSDSAKQQVEEQLAVQASVLGLTDALGKAGAAGKDAGDKTSTAFDGAKQSITEAAGAAQDAADTFNTSSQAWGDALAAAAMKAASASQGITLLTNEQIFLLREARNEWLSGALTAEQYAERVKVAMGGVDEALLASEKQLFDFNQAVADLKSQIAGASGDDTTQENIRHQQKIADLKEEFQVDGTLTSQQFHELERLEDQLHDANLKRIKDQASAQQAADTSAQGGGVERANGGATPPAPANTVQRGVPVAGLTIDFSGATIIGAGSKQELQMSLARLILPALKQIEDRSK